MRTVSSIRVKAAGESKEFRLVSEDATDSRLKSEPSQSKQVRLVSEDATELEPSDCVEVHVGDDVSQLIDVMFICGDWGSSKGGVPTFNREVWLKHQATGSGFTAMSARVTRKTERMLANKESI